MTTNITVEARSDAFSKVFRPFITAPGVAKFVAPGPLFPDFELDGVTYHAAAEVIGRPDPKSYGPRVALEAIAERRALAPMPKPLEGGDLLHVLEQAKTVIRDRYAPAPVGAWGNDVRLLVALDAARWLTGQGIPPHLAVAALGVEDDATAATIEASCATTHYPDSFARDALRRRDEGIAAKLAERRAQTKVDTEAARPNTKTNRQRGELVFTCPVTSSAFSIGPEMLCGAHKYFRSPLAAYGFIPIRGAAFEGFRLMSDDEVVPAPEGRLQSIAPDYSDHIAALVFKSRIGHVEERAIELSETFDDTTLDGEWRLRLAETVARAWPMTRMRVAACVRGLLIAPAVAEELVLEWKEAEMTKPDAPEHAADYAAARREGIRAEVEAAMQGSSLHFSPGELYSAPTQTQLDRLAVETGRDPWRALVKKAMGDKSTITSAEVETALREGGAITGTIAPSTYERIAKLMSRFFGLEKRNVRENGKQKKAFAAPTAPEGEGAE